MVTMRQGRWSNYKLMVFFLIFVSANSLMLNSVIQGYNHVEDTLITLEEQPTVTHH